MNEMTKEQQINQFGIQDIIVDLFSSLATVRELSELTHSTGSEKKIIKDALSVLIQNQDMERCSFFYLDEDDSLVNLAGISASEESTGLLKTYKPAKFKIGEGIIGLAAQTGELQNCQNCAEDERFSVDGQSSKKVLLGSIISVPVFTAGEKLIGVLNISHPEAYHFNEWHIRLLEIYKNMLGQLITNYQLFQEMEAQITLRTAKLELALTDLHTLKEHFESISMVDQLTGLYNRHYFYTQVELALANTKRYGHSLCLLMLDLDDFKAANDNHGHGFGDEVLVKFSAVMQQHVRDSDILARFGGEEFVVIFTNTDCNDGLLFAERIRKTIESLVWDDKPGFTQTISIGLYCMCDDDLEAASNVDIDKLIKYADVALYEAKHQGRNSVITFTEDMLQK